MKKTIRKRNYYNYGLLYNEIAKKGWGPDDTKKMTLHILEYIEDVPQGLSAWRMVDLIQENPDPIFTRPLPA